jgi:hypothetical protein
MEIPNLREHLNDEPILHKIAEENTVNNHNNETERHHLPEPGDLCIPIVRMMQCVAFQADHPTKPFRIHIDGGLNRSVTNDTSLLIHYRNIKKMEINGASNEGPILTCIGKGYLPWQASNGETFSYNVIILQTWQKLYYHQPMCVLHTTLIFALGPSA